MKLRPIEHINSCSVNMDQPTAQSIWMTAEEAAGYLRISLKTLYNYKCKGKLVGHNRGGLRSGGLLFKKVDLDDFISGK